MTQIAYPIRNSLYLNITDRCTLECRFCPKHTEQGPVVHDFDLSLDHRPEASEIIQAIGNPADYDEIVFCGFGEPTLRFKVLMEVARWVKAHGGTVRINTDGLANLVNKRDVLPEMQGVVDSLSVSMNAQSPDIYSRHCQPALPGSWEAMLAFLEEAPTYIPEVTATAIEGLEDVDIQACEQLAKQRGVAFRRRQLDKVG
ncbi:MAG TPA: radical SAM protein [Chromatiaceae bacterium]|nr:radical SAM protein [Chromatiaceae bacterium]